MNFENINKAKDLSNGSYWVKYENKKGKNRFDVCIIENKSDKVEIINSRTRKLMKIKRCKGINTEKIVHFVKEDFEILRLKMKRDMKNDNEIILAQPNPFIAIKTGPKSDTYSYSERKGIDSIAFIIQTGEDEYILTSERKPPMDARIKEGIYGIEYSKNGEAFIATAFGGSNDKMDVKEYQKLSNDEKIEYFKNIVFSEGIEEAGYKVSKNDIEFKGSSFVSTQSNQMCYLNLVDGRNAELVEKEPDSDMEAMAESKTYTAKQIKENLIDWKAKFIVS